MTAHAVPGRRPVVEALRAGRRLDRVLVDERGGPEVAQVATAARAAGVAVRRAPRPVLDEAAEGVRHQGVVGLAPPFTYRALHDLAALPDADLLVACDGLTDPQNLGSIARSAETAGAAGLVLPRRRSVHVTAAAEKASAGALSWLPVALVPNITRALGELAQEGFWSVGLDGSAQQSLWDSQLLDGKVVLVIGSEGTGLSRLVAERADARVSLPMLGRLESLNAAAAAAVALFEVARRRSAQRSTMYTDKERI